MSGRMCQTSQFLKSCTWPAQPGTPRPDTPRPSRKEHSSEDASSCHGPTDLQKKDDQSSASDPSSSVGNSGLPSTNCPGSSQSLPYVNEVCSGTTAALSVRNAHTHGTRETMGSSNGRGLHQSNTIRGLRRSLYEDIQLDHERVGLKQLRNADGSYRPHRFISNSNGLRRVEPIQVTTSSSQASLHSGHNGGVISSSGTPLVIQSSSYCSIPGDSIRGVKRSLFDDLQLDRERVGFKKLRTGNGDLQPAALNSQSSMSLSSARPPGTLSTTPSTTTSSSLAASSLQPSLSRPAADGTRTSPSCS